jgi:3-oxoacyl-[acyl-carrier protein] reductase
MKTLAVELGPQGIRFNSIVPGWTATERVEEILAGRAKTNDTTTEAERAKVTAGIPMGRMASPDEFADALTWLVSPRASYVHGAALQVDGGWIKGTL